MGPVYLDCNATTPLDEKVREVLWHYLTEEFGNEGSRTHEFGARAKQAVQKARDQVASLAGASRDEVIFTSGATESNNLAILGLAGREPEPGKRHVITTAIEHKAVLEPIEELTQRGFETTLVQVGPDGAVNAAEVGKALRPDTLLVSVMQANNETGVLQPLREIAEVLEGHHAYFHTDAAQGFGKELDSLRHPRLDLISVSGHKIFAPKGVGALICRRRGFDRVPLRPLAYGGGQERGLRPGTLPVAMVAALGQAAEMALREHGERRRICETMREKALAALLPLGALCHGNSEATLPHVLSLSFPGLDSEALILAVKDLAAISNGSACTSSSYTSSHVLKAMGMTDEQANEAVRLSWCHMTPPLDWDEIAERIKGLL